MVKFKPNKEIFEKCLADLITEKNKIILEEHDKELIEYINRIIESILIYLNIL